MLIHIMFRTAIPFGYLFIAVALFGLLIVGLTCFVIGWRTQTRPLQMIGAGLSFAVVGMIAVDMIMDSLLEWNPLVRNDATVIGTWSGERSMWKDLAETITLRADHTYEYHSDEERFSGKWDRNDWNLHITAEGGIDLMMRFIEYSGELRLLHHPPDDPDTWDGDLGLKRVLPGAARLK